MLSTLALSYLSLVPSLLCLHLSGFRFYTVVEVINNQGFDCSVLTVNTPGLSNGIRLPPLF